MDNTGCISLSHYIDQLLFLKEKAGQCNKTNAAIWWLLPHYTHYLLYYWNQVLRMRSSVWRPLRPSCAARTKNHAYHKQSSLFLAFVKKKLGVARLLLERCLLINYLRLIRGVISNAWMVMVHTYKTTPFDYLGVGT